MSLNTFFHPKAKAAFDQQAEDLVRLIVCRPGKRSTPSYEPPFVVSFHISQEDLIGPVTEHVSVLEDTVATFRHLPAGETGLDGAAHKEYLRLAEKIHRCNEVRDRISARTVEGMLFDWLIARHTDTEHRTFTEFFEATGQGLVKPWKIWIPVFGLTTEYRIQLGKITIEPLLPQFFDDWLLKLPQHKLDIPEVRDAIARLRKKYQGYAACTLKIVAEKKRAEEVAFVEAEAALAMLRTLMPTNLHQSLTSSLRPFGRESIESDFAFHVTGDLPPGSSDGPPSPPRQWHLSERMVGDLDSAGLGKLHEIYSDDRKSAFKRDLLESIFQYSRSSLAKATGERLVRIFTALDSLLLQNKTENIQQNIADRVAFAISNNAQERKRIASVVVKAYGLRSAAVHHNETIDEKELVEEFLRYVFTFYVFMIGNADVFRDRQHFFEWIDHRKYS